MPSSGAAGRREIALYCTIAAASFTCGVWFARSALPPAGRAAFDASAAHADASPPADAARAAARNADDAAALDDSWNLQEVRARYRTVAAQAAYAQAEVTRLKQELALARAQSLAAAANSSGRSQPTAAGTHNALEDPFYPPNPNELAEFVKSCTVRVDQPTLLDSTPGDVGEAAGAMHATPNEVRAMNEAMRDLHASFRTQLRALYAEAMGHPADNELSPRAMLGEFQDKRPPENAGLFADIVKERAGQQPLPADLSGATAYERAQRLYLSLGDEFQERVALAVGPERASALRAANGGWKWSRSQFAGCGR